MAAFVIEGMSPRRARGDSIQPLGDEKQESEMEADSHGSEQAVAGASPPPRPLPHRGQFPETRPSVVERAARCGDAQALRDLCAAYWYPVYCFLRRKGCSSTQSAEVTQAMFAKLLELDDRADGRATRVARFNPDRQRFR